MSNAQNLKTTKARSEILFKPTMSRPIAKPKILCDEAEYELFQKLIRDRLVECGWSEQIKLLCKEVIRERGSELTVNQLLEEVSIKAKSMLPGSVKRELLQRVKEHIQNRKTSPRKSLKRK